MVEMTEDDIARIESNAAYMHAEDCWPQPCRCFDFARMMRKRFEEARPAVIAE